jgi:hypothetical protein
MESVDKEQAYLPLHDLQFNPSPLSGIPQL